MSNPLSWLQRRLRGLRFRHLRAGNRARDRREWPQASALYQRHLRRFPHDGPIWVQYGHALKEGGRPADAVRAYEAARQQLPADADVLLHLGRLHRARYDFATAVDCFSRSAALDPANGADRDLATLLLPAAGADLSLMRWGTTDELTVLAHDWVGASPVAVVDPRPDIGGMKDDLAPDAPWIVLTLSPEVAAAPFAELTFTVPSDAGGSAGHVFVDYGTGFRDGDAVRLLPGPVAAMLLARPDRIARLRWQPRRASGATVTAGVAARAIIDPPTANEVLQRYELSGAERAFAEAAVIQTFAATDVDEVGLRDLQKLLPPFRHDDPPYALWLDRFATVCPADEALIVDALAAMGRKPIFSIVIPVFDPPIHLLRRCLETVLDQIYPRFELCVADDGSSSEEVRAVLLEYAQRDERVRVVFREQNGHIAAASNSAAAMATGDYIVLVDQDDEIPKHALLLAAIYVNRHSEASIFYSDEDKIEMDGTMHSPYFKGGFDRFLMFGQNLVSHLGIYRRTLFEQVGGFRLGFEGSQDYDLFWRCYEQTGDRGVVHIPHVLYHWRLLPGSTAMAPEEKDYAIVAARAAINGHFERTSMPLRSVSGVTTGISAVAGTRESNRSVTVLIPTRDQAHLLRQCLTSIWRNATGGIDIVIADNGSAEPEALRFLDECRGRGDTRVIDVSGPFNFSRIINLAAREANGEILCLLNNDTEVVSPTWLDRARLFLSLPDVGVVGSRLIYPDGSIQHAGIGLGMADRRVAATLHQGLTLDDPGYFGKARLLQQVGAVTAACLFVNAAAFRAIGGMEENLPIAYNDVDLCLRYRQAELKVLFDPEILLIHKESVSRGYDVDGERARRLDADAAWMHRRWGDALDNDPFWSPNLSLDFSVPRRATPPRVSLPWRRTPHLR